MIWVRWLRGLILRGGLRCVINRDSRVFFVLYLEFFLVIFIIRFFLIGVTTTNVHFLSFIFALLGLARAEIVVGIRILRLGFSYVGTLNLVGYRGIKF